MTKKYCLSLLIICILSCTPSKKKELVSDANIAVSPTPKLNLEEANKLVHLPITCMDTEYPNKLNQTIASADDLQTPKTLHPAFYGCFDWHSAVHGHWSLVSLLKQFPNLAEKEVIGKKLVENMSKENILTEVAYFDATHNKSFERTYGWAWLLKLAEELHTFNDPLARELEMNLQPLTDLIIEKYLEFLPKLNYPIRVGEHTNTAFGMSFAYDYAVALNHNELKNMIEKRAKEFYLNDTGCPITWEPSGFDFLSPCLEEAALMKRILSTDAFKVWISNFLPELIKTDFTLETGKVSDRTDGKLVHLDGVNFSRAWSLYKIAEGLPEYSHLKNSANQHINYSLPSIVDDSYEGGHWLGSFAIYALNAAKND
tara:strand:+ start:130269 stop:131381 length:1113 start_codon:yes stop_codon:yes gene_type:complete